MPDWQRLPVWQHDAVVHAGWSASKCVHPSERHWLGPAACPIPSYHSASGLSVCPVVQTLHGNSHRSVNQQRCACPEDNRLSGFESALVTSPLLCHVQQPVKYSSCNHVCTRIGSWQAVGLYRYVIDFTAGLTCCNFEARYLSSAQGGRALFLRRH